MKVEPLALPEVLLITPRLHGDSRGVFHEMFQAQRYGEAGIAGPWTQDNASRSTRGVLRGLHYQHPRPQGKLVSVLSGRIFDVAVDIRRSSPTFGRWVGAELDHEGGAQLWVPPGFAHGFLVLSPEAIVHYKCSQNFWSSEDEQVIRYDDPDIGIIWPGEIKQVHPRDAAAPVLKSAPVLPP